MTKKLKKKDQEIVHPNLINEIKEMINESRSQAATYVNVSLTILYWQIGKRIMVETLNHERAEYGRQIVATLSGELVSEYGNSFSEKNLRRMIQFYEVFPDEPIVVSLIRQLSWTHLLAIIPIKENLKRDFYIELCRIERWSVRALRKKIDSMLYERTVLSKKPEELIKYEIKQLKESDLVSTDLVLKDPYILDFLGLKDRHLEKDLEDAILSEMEQFILELGVGFAFIARQKRIQIDNDDFYIDLLFYNRKLKKLIAIDLKLSNSKAEYKGQMELYLRWLDKHERNEGEEKPLRIIMCTGKKSEQIELLELSKSGIHVAEYLTVLPPRELFQKKLISVIKQSRERFMKKEIL